MWRQLTRGLQQGFKRSLCLEKSDSCVKKEGKSSIQPQKCCFTELLPCVFQNLNHCVSKKEHRDQYEKDSYEKASRNISQHTFLEAFGWSGALVFGWAISKQIWLKHLWLRDEDVHTNQVIINNASVIQVLAQIVKTQPPVASVLPQLKYVPSKTDITNSCKSTSSSDDEFEAAAKELKEIHEKAIGESLNRRGIACLSVSTGSEAILYFQRASEFKYSPASFNLGQCYELGIGTKQDFKQAAAWYKVASEQGHATAMYNLGVFYAHGWGDLKADIVTAKKLFVKASKLGQPDAQAALDLESKSKSDLECKSDKLNFFVNDIKSRISTDIFPKVLGHKSNNWNGPFNSTVAF